MNGLTSIVMSQGSWFWKEAACRKDFSTLVGQLKANCKLVTKTKVEKSTGFAIVPGWNAVVRQIPEVLQEKWEQKATTKKEWKWQRGIVTHPLSESQWNRGPFQHEKVVV